MWLVPIGQILSVQMLPSQIKASLCKWRIFLRKETLHNFNRCPPSVLVLVTFSHAAVVGGPSQPHGFGGVCCSGRSQGIPVPSVGLKIWPITTKNETAKFGPNIAWFTRCWNRGELLPSCPFHEITRRLLLAIVEYLLLNLIDLPLKCF